MGGVLQYITINIDPIAAQIGPFILRWYGLMYILGIAVGFLIMRPYAKHYGLTSDQIWTLFWGVALAALAGGRLYYIVQNDPGAYLRHPGDIFAFWQGGMAFFGAIFLGVPVLLLLAWQQRVPLGIALNCAALFAPLAQAIGRVGNIINGDVYGYPTTLPWGTIYTNTNSWIPQHLLHVPLQPAAAYELLFSVVLFAVLWPLRFRIQPAGMLFLLYLTFYCAGQFFLFIWRDNVIVSLNLKQAQLTAVLVQAAVVIAAWLLIQRPWLLDPEAHEHKEYLDCAESVVTDPEQQAGDQGETKEEERTELSIV